MRDALERITVFLSAAGADGDRWPPAGWEGMKWGLLGLALLGLCLGAVKMAAAYFRATRRKQVDLAIKDEPWRLLDCLPQICWIADHSREITYWNPDWYAYTGLSQEASQGNGWMQAIFQEDLLRWNTELQMARPVNVPWETSLRIRNASGAYRWHLSRVVMREDNMDAPMGAAACRWVGIWTDIHDFKMAEEKIRAESNLATLVDAIPHAIWTASPDGYVDYLNLRIRQFTGRDAEALQGTGWLQIIHPDDREMALRRWTKALQHGHAFHSTYRVRGRYGQYRWYLSRALPRLDEQGKILQWVGSSTDIDRWKRFQDALAESESRFRNLIEQVPLMIFLTDAQRQNIYVNACWRDFTGLTLEESRERGWMKLIHPDFQEQAQQAFERSLQERKTHETLFLCRRADGEYRWIQTKIVARYSANHEFSGFVGVSLDITEQERIKEQLEERVQARTLALQKNSQLLNLILENVPAMIFMKNARTLRFEFLNRGGEELTGYSEAEFLGKNDADFFPPEQASFFMAKDQEILMSKQLLVIPQEQMQRKSGETRMLYTRKVPILDESSQPIHLLGLSVDITESMQSQQKIESLNRALQSQIHDLDQLNKELEAFAYSVSHDLRTPLRVIDGFAQMLVEAYGSQLDETAQRYLQRIIEGAGQMSHLIDGLLSLAKVTRDTIKREPVNLSEIAHLIVDDLKSSEPDRQVKFLVQENIGVDADRRLMYTVLENLLGNAWKFTAYQPKAVIEFGMCLQNGHPVYWVKDNGAGFDMDYADKLFGAFQRLHQTEHFAGSGIGLATVARVVHRHGGAVWAEGEIGVGATFYFTLPGS